MSYQLTEAAITDKGAVRSDNEDIYYTNIKNGIFFVSDGMGGNLGGKLASKTVYEKLPQLLKKSLLNKNLNQSNIENNLTKILNEVNNEIHKFANAQKSLKKIGATIALLYIQENKAVIAHLGDSRIYLHRDNKLERLTKDHSVVQTLVDSGNLQEKNIHKHPAKGNLLKSLGGADKVIPDIKTIEIKRGDRFLLTSDGVTDIISDFELEALLNRKEHISKICKDLFNETIAAGSPDNVTSVFIEIGEEKSENSFAKPAIALLAILIITFIFVALNSKMREPQKEKKIIKIKPFVIDYTKLFNDIHKDILLILQKEQSSQYKNILEKKMLLLNQYAKDEISKNKMSNIKTKIDIWWNKRARKVAVTNLLIVKPLTTENLNGVTEDILISKLEFHFSKHKKCSLVERKELKKAMNELKFNSSNLINQETAISIGKLTAAEFIVSGKVYKLSDKITISIKMMNISTGEIASIAEISLDNNAGFSNNKIYTSLTNQIIENSILKD